MIVLAAETSGPQGSLALFKDLKCVDKVHWNKVNSHSETITGQCLTLLHRNHLTLKKIDLFATGIGPGSFTGLRVAINFAKTSAYAQNKPVIGKNTFELIAAPLMNDFKKIRSAILAFRNLIYTCAYEVVDSKLTVIEPPRAMTIDEFVMMDHSDFALCGDLRKMYESVSDLKCLRSFTDSDSPLAENFQFFLKDSLDLSSANSWELLTPPLYSCVRSRGET